MEIQLNDQLFDVNALQTAVLLEEEAILERQQVESRLLTILRSEYGATHFAETFYFIRYDFCRLNFLVGARCGAKDHLSLGIAENIWEEHGAGRFPTHNQLYRDFLDSVHSRPEQELVEPNFARYFNQAWEKFCCKSPLPHALLALGTYEILDNPDYQLLLRVAKQAGIPKVGLRFFGVHAAARHFEMFHDTVRSICTSDKGYQAFNVSATFVLETQEKMWFALLNWLESRTTYG